MAIATIIWIGALTTIGVLLVVGILLGLAISGSLGAWAEHRCHSMKAVKRVPLAEQLR